MPGATPMVSAKRILLGKRLAALRDVVVGTVEHPQYRTIVDALQRARLRGVALAGQNDLVVPCLQVEQKLLATRLQQNWPFITPPEM
jgi:hypothetical protein